MYQKFNTKKIIYVISAFVALCLLLSGLYVYLALPATAVEATNKVTVDALMWQRFYMDKFVKTRDLPITEIDVDKMYLYLNPYWSPVIKDEIVEMPTDDLSPEETHQHNYVSTVYNATCTQDGYTTYACQNCDYSYVDNKTNAMGHNYQEIKTELTCENDGYIICKCQTCDYSYEKERVYAKGHDYKVTTIAPTNENQGYDLHECINCGKSYKDNYTDKIVSFKEVNEIVYAISDVNIRTGPDTNYSKLGNLKKGEAITRIGIGANGWSKVLYNEVEAYINSSYLTTKRVEYINTDNYTPVLSYGGLSKLEIDAVNTLLAEIKANLNTDETYVSVWIKDPNNELDYDSYGRISSFLAIYLSDWYVLYDLFDLIQYPAAKQLLLGVNMEVFRESFAVRNKYLEKIDSILETFTEGSEQHKLQQIADYLKDNVKYLKETPNGASAILNGRGNCNAYAMAFQTMANRLGITCDICVGFSDSGEHAWNRVVLSTGEVLFYDVCYYDSCKDSKYINRTTSPWKVYTLNNYYYSQWYF